MALNPGGIGPDDLERVAREADQALRQLSGLQDRLDTVRGTGTSADGLVVASADGSGRIDSIKLNPRAMRMASEELAEALLRAINAAQDDCARQTNGLIADSGVDVGGNQAAYEAMERQVLETHAAIMRGMERFSPGHGRG
ncbi:YbaB/EbfC family nucleoid-associated protein [Nonomuraea sp. NPDC049400]|uniref:YbaB/EbfC family nucleoid-associated protein n=1 Tax=Nonomuraea sp. NPDC049400 TaxID=3364352 RepID=UPI0037AEC615